MSSGRSVGRAAGSAAMSGKIDELKALAAVILWNSKHFDTCDIANALGVGEDAVCRTIEAARHIARGGA
ncbi:hypothetical protein AC244_16020 [Ensifer adhaerens]|uniref:Uncharacterized protein n=1 Tax=Ensifer adhaerens TaxID=106592 RepID=A0A0L8BT13_ENSAD|nr:hypothetical protein [Ensifer adhaerens]KOF17871.1 hypothetical protein AC244_16020 [Ensifer adhaerens]